MFAMQCFVIINLGEINLGNMPFCVFIVNYLPLSSYIFFSNNVFYSSKFDY